MCSKVSLTYLNQVPQYLGYLTTSGTSILQVYHYQRYRNPSDTSLMLLPQYCRQYLPQVSQYCMDLNTCCCAVPSCSVAQPRFTSSQWQLQFSSQVTVIVRDIIQISHYISTEPAFLVSKGPCYNQADSMLPMAVDSCQGEIKATYYCRLLFRDQNLRIRALVDPGKAHL